MKRACLTLDLEFDHDGVARKKSDACLRRIDSLLSLLQRLQIPITIFVTGEILADLPGLPGNFEGLACAFESHSADHKLRRGADIVDSIRTAKKQFEEFFSRPPAGFRAPFGVISRIGLEALEEEGFLYDSSFYGGRSAFRSENARKDGKPFVHKGQRLAEIPISSAPIIGLPLSLSYVQAVGLAPYRTALKLGGPPDPLVVNFHMHDIIKSPAFRSLPPAWKAYYARNRLRRSPIKTLEKFAGFLQEADYRFCLVNEIAEDLTSE